MAALPDERMGRRLIIGILKGLFIGGTVGALLHFGVGMTVLSSAMSYLVFGLVGAVSGALAGKAPWKPGAWIASILKGIFGVGVGCGLYALAAAFGPSAAAIPGVASLVHQASLSGVHLANVPLLFAPALAVLYATLVELDDGGDQEEEPTTRVRATNADELLASIPDEVEEQPAARPAVKRKG